MERMLAVLTVSNYVLAKTWLVDRFLAMTPLFSMLSAETWLLKGFLLCWLVYFWFCRFVCCVDWLQLRFCWLFARTWLLASLFAPGILSLFLTESRVFEGLLAELMGSSYAVASCWLTREWWKVCSLLWLQLCFHCWLKHDWLKRFSWYDSYVFDVVGFKVIGWRFSCYADSYAFDVVGWHVIGYRFSCYADSYMLLILLADT